MHLLMRLFFRGIYVPQMTITAWLRLIFRNRRSIFTLIRQGVANYRAAHNHEPEKAPAQAVN